MAGDRYNPREAVSLACISQYAFYIRIHICAITGVERVLATKRFDAERGRNITPQQHRAVRAHNGAHTPGARVQAYDRVGVSIVYFHGRRVEAVLCPGNTGNGRHHRSQPLHRICECHYARRRAIALGAPGVHRRSVSESTAVQQQTRCNDGERPRVHNLAGVMRVGNEPCGLILLE